MATAFNTLTRFRMQTTSASFLGFPCGNPALSAEATLIFP